MSPRRDGVVTGISGPAQAIPLPLDRLIGRRKELRQLERMVVHDGVRLITLAGPPGVGKTRLAIEVATRVTPGAGIDARMVDLAPVTHSDHGVPTIARALGRDDERVSPVEWIKRCARQPLLMVLDNVEQLLPAFATDLAHLLAACPLLTAVVTSREALHVRGEHVLLVQPPALPDSARRVDVGRAQRSPAVVLFVDRAREIVPNFALTPANVTAVVETCAHLDGLPLAIELAAARVALFPPEELRAHLEHPLDLLTDGPRDLPPRHRTLRAAIEWSYNLLQPEEQTLLRRMAVFSGGCTMEAVTAVCEPAGSTVELLTALVRKNLVQASWTTGHGNSPPEGDPTRYSLLETIREYALEQLAHHPDDDSRTRDRHTAYYLELSELAAAGIITPQQSVTFDHLEQDYNNLRTALCRIVTDVPDPELAVRMVKALSWFWYARGYLDEGWQWCQEALRHDMQLEPTSRAHLRFALIAVCLRRGDYSHALELGSEGVAFLRLTSELADLSHLLGLTGQAARGLGDLDLAEGLLEESIEISREIGHTWHLAGAMWALSEVALARNDLGRAEALAAKVLDVWWGLDDKQGSVLAMDVLAAVAFHSGEMNRARLLNERNLTLRRGLGDRPGMGVSLRGLAAVAFAQSQPRRATSLYLQSIDIALEIGDLQGISACLEGLARIALLHGHVEWAATLLGATDQARARGGMPVLDAAADTRELMAEVRDSLTPVEFTSAWHSGREGSLDETATKLRQRAGQGTSIARAPEHEPARPEVPLSRRERQVASLIAAGHDNLRIASELVLSKRTVETHVSNILRKLNLDTRVQIVLWAIGQDGTP